jgi:peroxiredoxin
MSNWRTMSDRSLSSTRRWTQLLPALLAAFGLLQATQAATPGLTGKPAPDFGLPAFVGDNVRLSEYRGQPVILSFWSSRCSTCAKQLAALDKLYGTYRSAGLVVLGIAIDDNVLHAREYARARATSYPLLFDLDKTVSRDFAIDRLPTTILIDRGGVVRYVHSDDGADQRSYVVQIRTLLDDKPAVP